MLGELHRAVSDAGTGNAEVVRDLERRFAQLSGASYGLCVSSGTAALISALWASGVRPGDRVAVSVLGPSMTGLAITAIGADPLFLDCASPTSFGVSGAAAAQAVREGVQAAVLIPMWGYWDENRVAIDAFRAGGVPIVVDAAQAPFLRLGNDLFTVADVVCLSLHGRKPFKAGEGGVCLTRDARLAERIVALRNFGQHTAFSGRRLDPTGPFATQFGVNFKINALGAAWCLTQLNDVDRVRTRLQDLRQAALNIFRETRMPWVEADQSADVEEHGRYGVVALCPTASDAQQLAQAVAGRGVEVDSSRYRYSPMFTAPHFARFAVACPNADQLTTKAVACRLEAFTAKPETEA